MVFRDEALRRRISYEGGVFTNVINALRNESAEIRLSLPPQMRTHCKESLYESGSRPLPDTGMWHLGLGFPRELTVRTKYLLFTTPSIQQLPWWLRR